MSRAAPLCPSGRCRTGATLLGIMGPAGKLIYKPGFPPLDAESAATLASSGGGGRYRFAEPCATQGCAHWVSGRCEVAGAAAAISTESAHRLLPPCGIRSDCRWFDQE